MSTLKSQKLTIYFKTRDSPVEKKKEDKILEITNNVEKSFQIIYSIIIPYTSPSKYIEIVFILIHYMYDGAGK